VGVNPRALVAHTYIMHAVHDVATGVIDGLGLDVPSIAAEVLDLAEAASELERGRVAPVFIKGAPAGGGVLDGATVRESTAALEEVVRGLNCAAFITEVRSFVAWCGNVTSDGVGASMRPRVGSGGASGSGGGSGSGDAGEGMDQSAATGADVGLGVAPASHESHLRVLAPIPHLRAHRKRAEQWVDQVCMSVVLCVVFVRCERMVAAPGVGGLISRDVCVVVLSTSFTSSPRQLVSWGGGSSESSCEAPWGTRV